MGQAKLKQESLPPGCVGPASYAKVQWFFAIKVGEDDYVNSYVANAVASAHDGMRLTPSAFNDCPPQGRLSKGDLTKIDVTGEEPGTTLLMGSHPLTREFGVLHRLPKDSPAEAEVDGVTMSPCTVEGLPAYAAKPTDVRTAVYETAGHVLRNADGSTLRDPLELCRGRLRWQDRPGRYWRADLSLSYLEMILALAVRANTMTGEIEGLWQHANGFSRACEVHPTAETRTLHACADRIVHRILANEDYLDLDLNEIRAKIAEFHAKRPQGAAYEALVRGTTLAEGEVLRVDRAIELGWHRKGAPDLAGAIALAAEASGAAGGDLPGEAAMIKLSNEFGELAAPQIRPIRRLCETLPKTADISAGKASGSLYEIGGGWLAAIDLGPRSYVFAWDRA